MDSTKLITLNNGSYTVSAGNRTVALDTAYSSLGTENIAYVYNKTQGICYHNTLGNDNEKAVLGCTLSAGTLTIATNYAVFAAGDVLIVKLLVPEVSAIETVLSETDKADAVTTRRVIEYGSNGYKSMSVHYKLVSDDANNTVTMTAFASNNASADATADAGWVDVSTTVLGAANKTATNGTTEGIVFVSTNLVCDRLMVKVVYTVAVAAGNSTTILAQKAM